MSRISGKEWFGYLIGQNTYHGKTKEVSSGYKDLVCIAIAISVLSVETDWYTVGSGKSRIRYDSYDYSHGANADGNLLSSSSVISSLVSKCKNNPRQLILFFYFKEAQKHGPSDMLRSITAQMCQNTCEKPEEAIRVLEKFYELGQLPSNEELLKIISTLTQKLDRVYVIIDGVGECVSRSALFKVVSKLLDKNDEGNFYVFVSSRDFPDLRHEIVGKHINLVVIRDYKDEAELV